MTFLSVEQAFPLSLINMLLWFMDRLSFGIELVYITHLCILYHPHPLLHLHLSRDT